MAEVVAEIPQTIEENMDVETEETIQNPNLAEKNGSNGTEKLEQNGDSKRSREDEENCAEGEEDVASKKQKVEKSVEEQRLEKVQETEGKEGGEEVEGGEEKKTEPVNLGPKNFSSSVEMFDYFFKFLHYWPPNLDVNKYEYLVLLDLLKKGHAESDKKVGGGVKAFQVRYHPMWKSRCFFLIREDESVDDFSFRKCVDHILPLPENMKVKADANKALGGRGGGGRGGGHGGRGGGGGGRRGGRGRGRGGWSRN
ncbi:Protein of unknown function DUF3223 [Macleaya cordata]|uniref:Uncharacterized protein n=1 Tax=Macleaya cordata TaxID=56857 RepID=A0A200PPD6_MACCD|nr:Protein of unknown function DUF3223 [Macleaya cordata]